MNEDDFTFTNPRKNLNIKHKMPSSDNQVELFLSIPHRKGVKTVSLGFIPIDHLDMWKDMMTEALNNYYWR